MSTKTLELPDLRTEALAGIDAARKFFDNTTSALEEKDSGFCPVAGMMTVAQQVAHVAQTIDWFREGCLEDRWDMDFAAMAARINAVGSLAEARRGLAEAWKRLHGAVAAMAPEKLAEPLPENPIFSGRPRSYAVEGIVDHTAHHRGSLAVYVRLLGRVPPMVYGEG